MNLFVPMVELSFGTDVTGKERERTPGMKQIMHVRNNLDPMCDSL